MNYTYMHKHFTICNQQHTQHAVHVSNICSSLKMAVVLSRNMWQQHNQLCCWLEKTCVFERAQWSNRTVSGCALSKLDSQLTWRHRIEQSIKQRAKHRQRHVAAVGNVRYVCFNTESNK